MSQLQKLQTASVLSALSPLEIIRLVAGHNEKLSRSNSRLEPIRVTLVLNGGVSVSGYINSLKEDSDSSCFCMIEHEDVARTVNVYYIPLWSLVSVKVHDLDMHLHLFSGGKIEAQSTGPSIMELRRKIADELVRLRTVVQTDVKLEVSWETITQDDSNLLGLYELIDSVMNVIHKLISDEFKRIAFRTVISVVRFQNAVEAELVIDDQILIVKSELKAGEEGRFSEEELLEAIDSIL